MVITPPVGVDLCGFGGRAGPSQGVHDDLRGCCLYLASCGTELLFVTADLVGLHRDEVAEIRAGIEYRTGVPPEAVMVSCSHTHSGPATHCLRYLGQQDDTYLSEMKERLVEAAARARSAARPAVAGTCREPVSVGVNRRELRDGRIVLGVNEAGVTDPYATVLCVDEASGDPVARLFCHAAHAVTLGGDNLLISGDWPGYAQRAVERRMGDACVALFMQGCCGDINSTPRGGFDVAEEQGRVMAEAIDRASEAASRTAGVTLTAASRAVDLPLLPPPKPVEARALHAQLRAEAAGTNEGDTYGTRKMRAGLVGWSGRILELAESAPREPRTIPFEIQALRVGPAVFMGLPGEVFVEYALNIAADSPFAVTAVAAYTNGNIGYVPTAKAYPEGGYEISSAIRFYGTTMPAPESEAAILEGAKAVLAELAG